ncbi:MAG: hypothetical protein H7Z42_11655 [Roseiflexaceae bacterium]|nr:hypothetical protein [Roseiflexaceae bacterium]
MTTIVQRGYVPMLALCFVLTACGSGANTAPTSAARATQAASTTPTADTSSASATSVPVATRPAPTDMPASTSAPAAASGEGLLIAVGGSIDLPLVSVLTKDGWKAPANLDLGLCLSHGNAFMDSTGGLWAICTNAFKSTDNGTTWQQVNVPFSKEYAQIEVAALDAKDQVWFASTEEVIVLNAKDGTKVAAYTATDTTKETNFPHEAMTVTKDGVLWLGGLNTEGSALVAFDGTTWTSYGSPETMGVDSYVTPNSFFSNGQGTLHIVAGSAIYRVEGKKLQKVAGLDAGVSSVRQVAQATNGDLAMATASGLARFSNNTTTFVKRADGLPSNTVNSVALDTLGRTWVATAYGIALQNGDTWQTALPSTSGLGPSRVERLFVIGAPNLPPSAATLKTTTISGSATENNKPLAKTKVQLCSETPSLFALESPCETYELQQIVETDADGRFTFTNVPLATYGIAAVAGSGKWVIFLSDIDGRADETVDIGAVDLTERK